MERRKEIRFKADELVQLEVLGPKGFRVPARMLDRSGGGTRIVSLEQVPVGAAVKVHIEDGFLLGETTYCQFEGGRYFVGIEVTEVLKGLLSLERLRRALLGSEPARADAVHTGVVHTKTA